MAELVDAPDSKSGAFGRSGSTPDIPTSILYDRKKDKDKQTRLH